MLQIEKLTKQFGDKSAVDAANIFVDKPAMIGIIGRSGAGKSTLLRMLNRLSDATSHHIAAGRGKAELAIALRDDFPAVQPGTPHGCRIERIARYPEQAVHACDDVQSISTRGHLQSHRNP